MSEISFQNDTNQWKSQQIKALKPLHYCIALLVWHFAVLYFRKIQDKIKTKAVVCTLANLMISYRQNGLSCNFNEVELPWQNARFPSLLPLPQMGLFTQRGSLSPSTFIKTHHNYYATNCCGTLHQVPCHCVSPERLWEKHNTKSGFPEPARDAQNIFIMLEMTLWPLRIACTIMWLECLKSPVDDLVLNSGGWCKLDTHWFY